MILLVACVWNGSKKLYRPSVCYYRAIFFIRRISLQIIKCLQMHPQKRDPMMFPGHWSIRRNLHQFVYHTDGVHPRIYKILLGLRMHSSRRNTTDVLVLEEWICFDFKFVSIYKSQVWYFVGWKYVDEFWSKPNYVQKFVLIWWIFCKKEKQRLCWWIWSKLHKFINFFNFERTFLALVILQFRIHITKMKFSVTKWPFRCQSVYISVFYG